MEYFEFIAQSPQILNLMTLCWRSNFSNPYCKWKQGDLFRK